MKLTEKTCLKKCAEEWSWLAKHPEEDKDDYFHAHRGRKRPLCDCYCCELVIRKHASYDIGCCECPLIELWTGKPAPNPALLSSEAKKEYRCSCENNQASPYGRWWEKKSRVRSALQIAKACYKILSKGE
jgi:hypothetical protein